MVIVLTVNELRSKFVSCSSSEMAFEFCPWATKVVSVCGGYMVFESLDDYIWLNQK